MRIHTRRAPAHPVALAVMLVLTLVPPTLVLAGCGVSAGAGLTGTIAGDVVAGPTCPVEQADNPCPNRPVADRQVTIFAASAATGAATAGAATAGATMQSGNPVASATTDANGDFSVRVPPGDYVVQVMAGPGMLGLRQETSGAVIVTADQTTTVHIVLDTGIR